MAHTQGSLSHDNRRLAVRHADTSITLRVYAHVINEQLMEAANIFANKIKAA